MTSALRLDIPAHYVVETFYKGRRTLEVFSDPGQAYMHTALHLLSNSTRHIQNPELAREVLEAWETRHTMKLLDLIQNSEDYDPQFGASCECTFAWGMHSIQPEHVDFGVKQLKNLICEAQMQQTGVFTLYPYCERCGIPAPITDADETWPSRNLCQECFDHLQDEHVWGENGA